MIYPLPGIEIFSFTEIEVPAFQYCIYNYMKPVYLAVHVK